MRPPLRVSVGAQATVSGTPAHSRVRSAPSGHMRAASSGVAAVSVTPSARASSCLAGWRVKSIVSAPASRDSWSASSPITPPPMTRTRSPAAGAPISSPWSVQASGSQKAPCSGSRSAGSGTAFHDGKTAYSAKPPVAVNACGDVPFTEIDPPAQACLAAPAPVVGITDDARALGYLDACATADDNARELVPERHRRGAWELAFVQMAVGPANARRLDPDQHLARARVRYRDVSRPDVMGSHQSRRAHGIPFILVTTQPRLRKEAASGALRHRLVGGCLDKPHQHRAVRHLRAFRDDLGEHAVMRGGDRVLHLHGFEHQQWLALGDGVALAAARTILTRPGIGARSVSALPAASSARANGSGIGEIVALRAVEDR